MIAKHAPASTAHSESRMALLSPHLKYYSPFPATAVAHGILRSGSVHSKLVFQCNIESNRSDTL